MGLWDVIKRWRDNFIDEPDFDGEDEEWDKVVYDRSDLNMADPEEREEYVKGCLEQIADAKRELENLQFEYNMVTSYLTDMEEIEAMEGADREQLNAVAKKLSDMEDRKELFIERKSVMDDAQFHQMERLEDEVLEGITKMREAEEYQEKIRHDLRKLEREKHAYQFRKTELKDAVEDTRGMTIICIIALAVCFFILLILHMVFDLDTKVGYLMTALVAAVAITMIFVRYHDNRQELARVERGVNRLIRLQNAVKIRYVNNTNLLDYLYLKYQTNASKDLQESWNKYIKEKEERIRYRKATLELDGMEQSLLEILRPYRLKDPTIWLRQTKAILDPKEMVEIRHNLIIRRQSLRRRMDYNKDVVAHKAENEIRDLVEQYPKYAKEILRLVDKYDKDFN